MRELIDARGVVFVAPSRCRVNLGRAGVVDLKVKFVVIRHDSPTGRGRGDDTRTMGVRRALVLCADGLHGVPRCPFGRFAVRPYAVDVRTLYRGSLRACNKKFSEGRVTQDVVVVS